MANRCDPKESSAPLPQRPPGGPLDSRPCAYTCLTLHSCKGLPKLRSISNQNSVASSGVSKPYSKAAELGRILSTPGRFARFPHGEGRGSSGRVRKLSVKLKCAPFVSVEIIGCPASPGRSYVLQNPSRHSKHYFH